MRVLRPVLASSLVAASLVLVPGAPAYAAPAAAEPRGPRINRPVPPQRPTTTGRLVVGYHRSAPNTGRARALAKVGARVHRDARGLHAALVTVPGDPAAARAALLRDPAVRYVEPESSFRTLADLRGPERIELGVNAAVVEDSTLTGSGIEVAVIDTAVDADNPDLLGRVVTMPDIYAEDDPGTPGDLDCVEARAHTADCAHGTAVATVLAADDGNGAGMMGVAPDVTIVSFNVFQTHDWASNVAIANAIHAATQRSLADPERRLRVVNLSLGGPFDSLVVRDAIAAAHAAGIVVVVAAGNDGGERPQYPAGDPYTISVGASALLPGTDRWYVAEWSNRGDVDVLAPGQGVLLWWPPDSDPNQPVLTTGDGTSFAAPMVAGIAAVLAQKGYVGDIARAAIVASAEVGHSDAEPPIADGAGRADLKRAWETAKNGTPYTGVFVDRGGAVARTTGRRKVEVIRVDPNAAEPNLPAALSLSAGAGALSLVETTVDTTGGPAVIRTTATFAAGNPTRPDGSITARGSTDEVDVTAAPLRFLDASNGPEGQPAYSGDGAAVALTYGVRSSYVRSAGLHAGARLDLDFRYDADFDPRREDFPPSTTELMVWAPATAGGEADAALQPWGVHRFDGALSGGNYVQLAEGDRPGRWKVGWMQFGWWDDGTYYLRTRFAQPSVTVSSPAVVSSSGTGMPFRVTWTTRAAHPVTVDVEYSVRTKVAGVWRNVRRPWLRQTTATGAVFGRDGSPVAVVPGTAYDVHVRVVDDLGNASKWVTRRTVVPLNDGSRGTNWSGGWRLGRSASRWLGDTHYSGSAGSSLAVISEGFRFQVIGDRCYYCGQFRAYVDGKLYATVDTKAGGTYARQVLWTSPVLSGGIRKHTLTVVVVGTRGRPTVSIDAIGVER